MLLHSFAVNHYCFSYYVSKVKETASTSVWTVSREWWQGVNHVIIAEWSEMLMTVLIMCQRSNILQSVSQMPFGIACHYVLKWSKNCTEIVHPLVLK